MGASRVADLEKVWFLWQCQWKCLWTWLGGGAAKAVRRVFFLLFVFLLLNIIVKEEYHSASIAGMPVKSLCIYVWHLLGFMLIADTAVASKALVCRPELSTGWSSCSQDEFQGFWVETTLRQLFGRWCVLHHLKLSWVDSCHRAVCKSSQSTFWDSLLLAIVLWMGEILKGKAGLELQGLTCLLVMLTGMQNVGLTKSL